MRSLFLSEMRRSMNSPAALLDVLPEAVFVIDSDSLRVEDCNATAETMLGYSKEQLTKLDLTRLVAGLDPAEARARWDSISETDPPDSATWDLLCADRTVLPVDASIRFLRSEEGRPLVVTTRGRAARQGREKQLLEANARLRSSNRYLEQLTRAVSHDLQAPLRMIHSYMQLVERRYADRLDQDGRDFLGFAIEGAIRMQSLIADLLSYSRITQQEISGEDREIAEIVDSACFNLKSDIEANGATIELTGSESVWGDEGQLIQLFQNLIGNSIKFAGEEPPRVRISSERGDSALLIRVHDNGIGIEPKFRERIFQIFQRLHGPKEFPGTGIGLAICRGIMESHGGTVELDSKVEDGTAFILTFPNR